MKQLFSNATVMWTEEEILLREHLVREIACLMAMGWKRMNPAIDFFRVETPVLTPGSAIAGHVDSGFDLLAVQRRNGDPLAYLRPETTAGSFAAFENMYPQREQRIKRLPYCVWQAGLSFRDEEKGETMRASKLRLRQFYQLEFQLFCRADTKAPYIEQALHMLRGAYGGDFVMPDSLPHYSRMTRDWMIGDLEVAGCSIRTDWPDGEVHEVAIGLDRLVATIMAKRISA